MRTASNPLISATLASILLAAPSPGGGFDALWSDGKAEISLYEGQVTRYGHPRRQALQITVVKEPFLRDTLVKAEGEGDLEVLKLHAVQTFSTGTYDYHRSWTVFLDDSGRELKETAVSVDGCGTAFHELRRTAAAGQEPFVLRSHSYWEGESMRTSSFAAESEQGPHPLLDGFPLSLRLRPLGKPIDREQTVVPSLVAGRLGDFTPAPGRIRIEPGTSLKVPAGAYRAVPVRVEMGEEVHRYWFDAAPPHVLLRYAGPEQTWELKKTFRLDYWNHKDPGDESLLR